MIPHYKELARAPEVVDNMLDLPEQKRRETVDGRNASLEYNPTLFPDRFLHTLSPVFTIRHPAIQVASWYRAMKPFGVPIDDLLGEIEFNSSYKFTRRIFDYFKRLHGE